jgi:hypothetical protein
MTKGGNHGISSDSVDIVRRGACRSRPNDLIHSKICDAGWRLTGDAAVSVDMVETNDNHWALSDTRQFAKQYMLSDD